jgi:hypothetical protein
MLSFFEQIHSDRIDKFIPFLSFIPPDLESVANQITDKSANDDTFWGMGQFRKQINEEFQHEPLACAIYIFVYDFSLGLSLILIIYIIVKFIWEEIRWFLF